MTRRPTLDHAPGRLHGKVALIAGGDSGIGRAVALAFARDGADIAIVYLNDHRGAEETRQLILRQNARCLLIAGDTAQDPFCRYAVKRVIAAFKRLDILVNNATEEPPGPEARDGGESLRANLLGIFCLTKAAAPHLPTGGAIISTTAVTSWGDSSRLIDDAATTGTIVSFTRAVARTLVARRIRVNALTPASLGPRARRQQAPALAEIASSYVFLAAPHSRFMTGQLLHAHQSAA